MLHQELKQHKFLILVFLYLTCLETNIVRGKYEVSVLTKEERFVAGAGLEALQGDVSLVWVQRDSVRDAFAPTPTPLARLDDAAKLLERTLFGFFGIVVRPFMQGLGLNVRPEVRLPVL